MLFGALSIDFIPFHGVWHKISQTTDTVKHRANALKKDT
jgi:hypothetical protein